MHFLFSYLPASQHTISSLLQSISPSSTESASFRPSVSSQLNNILVNVSLTSSRNLPLATGASAITELSSQGMCVCPCNPASTRSQSTSLPYHSTIGGIFTSSTLEQSSPLFYILPTTSTSKTSASASLSSSVCYCPCTTTSSTSYLLCKYWHRRRLAYSENFLENWKTLWVVVY